MSCSEDRAISSFSALLVSLNFKREHVSIGFFKAGMRIRFWPKSRIRGAVPQMKRDF